MKTLTFYSYKGGQGRTTAVANIGSCLYRLGYNVVLLDLDMESPGLSAKFDRCVFRDPEIKKNGGVLDYLLDSYGRMLPLESIERYSLEIHKNNLNGKESCIRLIPTGYVDKKNNYFNALVSTGWKYLSRLSESGPNKLVFFKGLQNAIERLTPKPDYLLIDLSAGNTAFGRISLAALAETVFFFFGPDQENIDGMRYVLEALEEIPSIRMRLGLSQESEAPLNLIPALCRIPPFLHQKELSKIRRDAHKRLYKNAKGRKIIPIHSDADLEKEWKLRIPYEGDIPNYQLTRDYFNLLVAAWPHIKQSRAKLRLPDLLKFFNLSEEINEQYRVFQVEHTQGVIVNLSDGKRNVSFKVETFCGLLNDIHKGIVEQVGPKRRQDEKTREMIAKATENEFYQAGRVPGANFGQNLVDKVWENRKMNDTDRLNEWCKFDSSVGFGNMLAHPLNTDRRSGRVKQGVIEVGRNFLAENRDKTEINLCELFRGYIWGVLGQILNSEVEVKHPENSCMRINHSRESCDFHFKTISRRAHRKVRHSKKRASN